MDKTQSQSVAFQVIAYSGDAFQHFYESVELAQKGKFDEAQKEYESGNESLNEAHKAQTDLLTAEANQEDVAFSVILVHAQDHLMTTIMYSRIAKQMIEMCRKMRGEEQ